MATILTAMEASRILRVESTDSLMLDVLPQVDGYIEQATGRDWAADATIEPVAKAAARILLVMWYENPGMLSGGEPVMTAGLRATLMQLEAKAVLLAEEEAA